MSKKTELRQQQKRVQRDLRDDSSTGHMRLARLNVLQQPSSDLQDDPVQEPSSPPAKEPLTTRPSPSGRSRPRQGDRNSYLDAVCAYAAPGAGPHCNLGIAVEPELLDRLIEFEDAVERTYRRRVFRTGIIAAAINSIDVSSPPVATQRAAPGTLQEKIIVRVSVDQREQLRTWARSTRPRTPVTVLVAEALNSYLTNASNALAISSEHDTPGSSRPQTRKGPVKPESP